MDNLRHIILLLISDLTMFMLPIRMATKINTVKKVTTHTRSLRLKIRLNLPLLPKMIDLALAALVNLGQICPSLSSSTCPQPYTKGLDQI